MADEPRSFDPPTKPGPTHDPTPGGAGDMPGAALDDRNAAGLRQAGDLGASTPPGVDVHKLGQPDQPQQDWGSTAGEAAVFSANHSRRGVRTEAERSQGAKTRRLNKDIVSRRGQGTRER